VVSEFFYVSRFISYETWLDWRIALTAFVTSTQLSYVEPG